MAEQKDDIEVAEDKSAKTTKLLMVIIAVLLLAVVALGVFMFMGNDDASDNDTASESLTKQAPIYFSINDPFIVNFSEQSQNQVRYLQVKMKVMARNQTVIDAVKQNLPAIQHELLLLLYSQKYDDLQSSEGTQALQQACLETINRIIKSESSLEDELKAVYFTSFIMQ